MIKIQPDPLFLFFSGSIPQLDEKTVLHQTQHLFSVKVHSGVYVYTYTYIYAYEKNENFSAFILCHISTINITWWWNRLHSDHRHESKTPTILLGSLEIQLKLSVTNKHVYAVDDNTIHNRDDEMMKTFQINTEAQQPFFKVEIISNRCVEIVVDPKMWWNPYRF